MRNTLTDVNGKITTEIIIQENTSYDSVNGIERTYPKKLLDSIIVDMRHPWDFDKIVPESVKKYGQDSVNAWIAEFKKWHSGNFKMYRFRNEELVHYRIRRVPYENDTIIFHEFSYSGEHWNEDGGNSFLYNTELGIVAKYTYIPIPDDVYWLSGNSCITDDKVKKKRNAIIKYLKENFFWNE